MSLQPYPLLTSPPSDFHYFPSLCRDYGTVNPDQDATFEGQAPIHVVINEKSGKMELDKDLHETTTGPSFPL
jgi:hypothetical protein